MRFFCGLGSLNLNSSIKVSGSVLCVTPFFHSNWHSTNPFILYCNILYFINGMTLRSLAPIAKDTKFCLYLEDWDHISRAPIYFWKIFCKDRISSWNMFYGRVQNSDFTKLFKIQWQFAIVIESYRQMGPPGSHVARLDFF